MELMTRIFMMGLLCFGFSPQVNAIVQDKLNAIVQDKLNAIVQDKLNVSTITSTHVSTSISMNTNSQTANKQQEGKKSRVVAGKALTSEKNKKNQQTVDNKGNSPLPKSRDLGHTERPKTQRNPRLTSSSVDNEQAQLDKGLIDAQIDDVLSSAEFLALENSAQFSKDKKQSHNSAAGKKDKAVKQDGQSADDPEYLLNQLDASDLMDYVAEDDLWKEQLTIEDKP